MTEFSTVTSNGRPAGSHACPLQADSVLSAFARFVPNQEHGSAKSPPCISKVRILRVANENWLRETSPLSQQRRELSREVRDNIEKARGFFSRSFSIGARRNGDLIATVRTGKHENLLTRGPSSEVQHECVFPPGRYHSRPLRENRR